MSDHELQRQAEEHAVFFRALVDWLQERIEKRQKMKREMAKRRAERMAILLFRHHKEKFLALKRKFLAALKQNSN